VGSDAKKEGCLNLGADYVFNFLSEDYGAKIKALGGCDIVLDIMGGAHINHCISALRKYGKLISIAVMTGSKTEINMGAVLMKTITIVGSLLRGKTNDEKRILIEKVVSGLYPLIEGGIIKPVIDTAYEFEDFNTAFDRMRSRKHFGKLLLKR
jgi:NADPH:quinone reductase-like Zn-dependent oxidoreductase